MTAAPSFEAIASVRKRGAIGIFEQKWMTVPTDDRAAAMAAFHALGYEVNSLRVVDQTEATRIAEIIGRQHP